MGRSYVSGSGSRRRLAVFLPSGRELGAAVFDARHRGLLVLLSLHAPLLTAFALLRGFTPVHALAEGGLVAAFAVAAAVSRGQGTRSVCVALGLVVSSSVLVHLWGGAIEGHFHFFVVMTFLALYQSWLPFLAALGFIVLEHGVLGAVAATSVYNHEGGGAHPWTWAAIHGGFVLASCVGNLLAWRLTEDEALHDSLTGLANRSLLLDCLEARLSSRQPRTAVLFLDLDDFKDTNDGFGHEVGDELLVAVAGRLTDRLGRGDLLARLGGDEFAVVLTAQTEACAEATAARLLDAFAEPFDVGELSVVTRASAGVATAGPASTPVSLLRDADLAMYAAKRSGGARCVAFTPAMHDDATRRSAMINDFPRALGQGEFVVHYQPVFALVGGDVVGVEALVRWQHPTRGLVLPGEFVEAAEQSGFILALGEHVLRTACAQAREWSEQFPDRPRLVLSVNLSPRQLAERDLLATVARVLGETGMPPEALCLEVTEGALIRDLEESVPRLRSLSAVGIRLALDDFGTGYSSLSYLQQMPVDILKVDRSFVQALAEDAPGTAIVRAVVELAHQLGLSVTAEGIETPQQQEILASLGCERGQGYLRARPVTADGISRLLQQERAGHRVPRPRPPQPSDHPAPAPGGPCR